MNVGQTLLIGFGFWSLSAMATCFESQRTSTLSETSEPASVAVTLTWTQGTQSWTGGDWDGGVQAAADYAGEGYTDWRLPTVQELQAALQIPAGQPGSWGTYQSGAGTGRGWTSKSQGNWAYAVTIATDVNGEVITAQSGESKKHLKGSNFARTKFVRP